jgi:hypothetical protein
MKITYWSNNSGGGWWLTDSDWYNLEKAGWVVDWQKNQEFSLFNKGEERFLGALATSASRHGLPLEQAVSEFEIITGQDANDEGCECCGKPHSFFEEEE